MIMKISFQTVFILTTLTCMVSSAPPLVNVPGMGMLEGTNERSTAGNKPFFSFNGIPFAKPPVGELRFKAPEPAEPWKGIRSARNYGNICPQSRFEDTFNEHWQGVYNILGDNPTDTTREQGSEDCLYLNVYTSNLDTNAKLPVMVYVHGGSFRFGNSGIYKPDYFMDHEMVMVVIQYRIGPLGFMSMQNEKIPGNAGMLDQVFALEWVQKYIHAFGGDKDQVTAFGESAGGASVSLLALSPLTKGLFKRIIGQSGAALAQWTFDRDPVYNAVNIASLAGCTGTHDEISDCLMAIEDPGVLCSALNKWSKQERKLGRDGFGGAIPTYQRTGKIFLDKAPEEVWADPEFETVPAMFGSNKHEGTFVLAVVYSQYIVANDLLEDEDFMKYGIMTPFLGMLGTNDAAFLISDAVECEYVGRDNMGNLTAMAPGLIDLAGATFLRAPGFESVKKHAKFGASYNYAFNFFGTLGPFFNALVSMNTPFTAGVCHAADIPYLFSIPGVYRIFTRRERELSQQMTKLWFNFAKYGNPTPVENPVEGIENWPAYDPVNQYYLRFDTENQILSDFSKEYTIARDENFGLV